MRVRQPAVAGQFYTGDPYELAREVDDYLAAAPVAQAQPAGVIVPHAGHIYSGPVAAYSYATLRRAERVVLAGPAHYVPVWGVVAPSVAFWRTPLGDIEIDQQAIAASGVPVDDYPHAPEHSLEVQLPFLQQRLEPGWRLFPLLVGRADPGDVADLLEGYLADPDTIVVLSTDLSHYHPYRAARARDEATAARIVKRDWQHIADQDACGAYPLRGLLLAAERLDLPVRLLDLRNSGDTAGPRDRVVGYGAFAVGG
ncbi:MAG TPA: AmmeMemoRadiSam system protein B [Actinomycetota bacterium]|nr:AmmeMemoRadiSam system protein B [Actinomycetota bacterium]